MKNLVKTWMQKNPRVMETSEMKKIKIVKNRKASCPNCEKKGE